jgi:L-lactate dehydrogenase complex protein LldG
VLYEKMMTSSRDKILNKLREARKPFPDAPPRPKEYYPVAVIDDFTPDGLLARFTRELEALFGQVFVAEGDEAARDCVLDIMRSHNTTQIIAWDFAHIPVAGLEGAIREAGIEIMHPEMHDEFRMESIEAIRGAQIGLTGADYAIAATGTLAFSTGPGKGRLPTVIAPVLLVVITLDQIIPRMEEWVAIQRANGLDIANASANVAFTSGPSRTADISMELVRGVHGSGEVRVVVKR